ncbi:hypothetical protein FEZ60_19730 [Rhodococcus sp. MS16]|uniref:hypothetical protein n=1 Tax=unclassified Rhodococcus (in: high G+C Gram-positive bacteria) TaxID=192944 RepID=UPI00120F666D|nr:hypothetical protein [Rhodococcus sp. (in: high G+C Gram-positive bacteria)]NRI67753.1 hypothetical protein [Rhodococcus sp. MS16]RZL22902.1 MAG: hypothetical protein EOP31_21555 [Rhodococcus sp. (in: high G+C Gram-positive bacteria)]
MTVSTSAPHSPSATTRFLALAALCAAALGILYFLRPDSPTVTVPESLRSVADQIVRIVDVTAVLTATAALAAVSMIRTLPYGIGAILMLGVGANLTSAALGSWLTDAPTALLPSGHVVAAAALYGSAVLISAPRWRPVIVGLGISGVAAVAVSVVATEMSGIFGVVAGLLIAAAWGCVAAILMEHSPVAAKREAARPDTAAIAFSRDRRIHL